jgi:transposase
MANTRTRQSQSPRVQRAQFWREHIHSCEASGQSIAAYCRANGLSAPSFHWWKRKLNSSSPPSALFAEVHPESLPSGGEDAAIEILVASGRMARVRPGFDAATLARVLAVLEARSC